MDILAENLEGISHFEEMEPSGVEARRLENVSIFLTKDKDDVCISDRTFLHLIKQLPVTIISMIAFACNQRCNGLQLQNSLSFLACGVSDRVNDYLQFLGLTSSRQTALTAMDTLGAAAEITLKEMCSKDYNIHPTMTLDNIDIQARIHDPRIESTTKMFHGSYGYLHFLPENLLKDIKSHEASVENLLKCIRHSQTQPFDISSMLPNQEESNHWNEVLKSQLSNALLTYIVKEDSPGLKACKKSLATTPPPIEPIEMYEPTILMLKMMSASDNSAAGVSEMISQCNKQTGEDINVFSKFVRIIEGDMGTILNFESLIRQRFPAGHVQESLRNVLNLPGLAHTMWNVSSAVISHHWGDTKDSSNTGLHRTAAALGMKTDRLPSQQYFSSLMQVIHKSHTSTMVFLLRYEFCLFID